MGVTLSHHRTRPQGPTVGPRYGTRYLRGSLVGCGLGSWKWTGKGYRAPHQGLHHIGFVVPKRFGSKENVHQVVAADHFQDRGAGAEGAAAAAPISTGET